MSDSSETFRLFNVTSESRILADLERFRHDLHGLSALRDGLKNQPISERSDEEQALSHHYWMIFASCIASRDPQPFSPEEIIFTCNFAAESILHEVSMIAHGKGRLDEIMRQMHQITERDGVGEDGYCMRGEGPEDYQALDEEYSAAMDSINDAVRLELFKKYRMHAASDLFESDRKEFDIQAEIGRRVMMGPATFDDDTFWETQFGQAQFRRMKARVEEITQARNL